MTVSSLVVWKQHWEDKWVVVNANLSEKYAVGLIENGGQQAPLKYSLDVGLQSNGYESSDRL